MSEKRTLLIANRGEIARRIIRSAREAGLRTVAVYSEADANAPHIRDADIAVPIGPAPAAESYLSIDRLIAAARGSGADLVHPGYGFLSENAAFAQACLDSGLTFVGPSPEVIALMGNKRLAKDRMLAAGVPCVQGWQGDDQSTGAIAAAARGLGLPVMVKAAAGGGGRGMRMVRGETELEASIESARSEAESTFGDGTLLIEKLIDRGRHVEVQVFGDQQGTVVHLGARDCSTQRRHQKVIEEAPPAFLRTDTVAALCAAAVQAASAIGYVGAGTVEFLVDVEEHFYFLEMNTRLQVEHPVTEMITGEDLVAWQLAVAVGEALPKTQEQISFSGHAIEARLYAEDPAANFLPQSGPVLLWQPPSGDGIRVDAGIETGGEISPAYDPMVAKVIAHGADRKQALARLIAALGSTVLLGVRTNKAFLLDLLRGAAFSDGTITTDYLDGGDAEDAGPAHDRCVLAVASALLFEHGAVNPVACWWSTGPARSLMIIGDGEHRHRVMVSSRQDDGVYDIAVDGDDLTCAVRRRSDETVEMDLGGIPLPLAIAWRGPALWLDDGGGTRRFDDLSYVAAEPASRAANGTVIAPIAGRAVRVTAENEMTVAAGDLLVVVESMKIEHAVTAPVTGTIRRVAVAAGDQVAARALLVEIEPTEAAG